MGFSGLLIHSPIHSVGGDCIELRGSWYCAEQSAQWEIIVSPLEFFSAPHSPTTSLCRFVLNWDLGSKGLAAGFIGGHGAVYDGVPSGLGQVLQSTRDTTVASGA